MRAPSRVISEHARPSAGSARDDLPGRGRVRLAGREPEEEVGERVAQRLGEHALDLLGRADALAHLVLERLHRAQPVGARAVEAPVDDRLHARAQRPERERDDERARRRHPSRSRGRRATPAASVMPMYAAASSSVSVP